MLGEKIPIVLDTISMGKLLFYCVFSIKDMVKLQKLKGEDVDVSDKEFIKSFIVEFCRKFDEKNLNKKEAYDEGEKIVNIDAFTEEDFEVIATSLISNPDSEFIDMVQYYFKEDNAKTEEDFEDFKRQYENKSAQEYFRSIINLIIAGQNNQIKKISRQFLGLGISKEFKESIAASSMKMASIDLKFNKIEIPKITPLSFGMPETSSANMVLPDMKIPINPVHESNKHLYEVSKQLESINLRCDSFYAYIKEIKKQSIDLVSASRVASIQASFTIFVAIVALVISTWTSYSATKKNSKSNIDNTKILRELVKVEKSDGVKLLSTLNSIQKKDIMKNKLINNVLDNERNISELILDIYNKMDRLNQKTKLIEKRNQEKIGLFWKKE